MRGDQGSTRSLPRSYKGRGYNGNVLDTGEADSLRGEAGREHSWKLALVAEGGGGYRIDHQGIKRERRPYRVRRVFLTVVFQSIRGD